MAVVALLLLLAVELGGLFVYVIVKELAREYRQRRQ